MPKISIVIPFYNLGSYIEEAVDSVLNQTFTDFEIIIVNDGSTDSASINLINKINNPKTTVFNIENQGLPAARNFGINLGSGDYIACLDADDKLHPDFLEKTIEVFDHDTQQTYGIVSTYYEHFENLNAQIKIKQFNPYALAVQNQLHVASLFRKSCWEQIGGYDTGLTGYQDWEFWLSIIEKGYQWFTVPEFLFYYRNRTGSMVKHSDKNREALFKQIVHKDQAFYKENLSEI